MGGVQRLARLLCALLGRGAFLFRCLSALFGQPAGRAGDQIGNEPADGEPGERSEEPLHEREAV